MRRKDGSTGGGNDLISNYHLNYSGNINKMHQLTLNQLLLRLVVMHKYWMFGPCQRIYCALFAATQQLTDLFLYILAGNGGIVIQVAVSWPFSVVLDMDTQPELEPQLCRQGTL